MASGENDQTRLRIGVCFPILYPLGYLPHTLNRGLRLSEGGACKQQTKDERQRLHNLRSFEAHIAAFINQARIDKTPLSLLVLDLDRLKSLNDNFGHLAGADAVRTVGELIARHIPSNAVACRYGGDEFVIALPKQTIEQAIKLAEVLRQAVYDAQPTLRGRPFPPARFR
ncbi:MAG TPA: GGDEF domain-containing protein [Pyrinomonadaceae bacterium]